MKIQSFILIAFTGMISFSGISQMRPGLMAGINYSTVSMSELAASEINYNPGFHIKGIAEFVLSDLVSFETGLGYSTKGFKTYTEASFTIFGTTYTSTYKSTVNFNYLNVPLVMKFGLNAGEGRVYAGVGPDVYFMLNGNSKTTTTQTAGNSTSTTNDESKIDFANDDISRFDLGARAVLGYEKNGFFVEAGYENGFINLNTDPNYDNTILNRAITLSLGFKLGGY